jgi:hypothetical protein
LVFPVRRVCTVKREEGGRSTFDAAAMRTYVHDYGIGPWDIYEFNPET